MASAHPVHDKNTHVALNPACKIPAPIADLAHKCPTLSGREELHAKSVHVLVIWGIESPQCMLFRCNVAMVAQ
eukprot:scaffold28165_cov17-Tisochrysis_lutea.AAC.2